MTLAEYIDMFDTYYGFLERNTVKNVALEDRNNASICFAALAREIAADPRHGINERLRKREGKSDVAV